MSVGLGDLSCRKLELSLPAHAKSCATVLSTLAFPQHPTSDPSTTVHGSTGGR